MSRHAYQGAATIEALESEGALPYVVVVNLGTNDDPRAVRQFGSYVGRVVRAAGPERCVIWATIIRPPYAGVSYDGLNKVLVRGRQAVAELPRLRLASARARPPGLVRVRRRASVDSGLPRAGEVARVVHPRRPAC